MRKWMTRATLRFCRESYALHTWTQVSEISHKQKQRQARKLRTNFFTLLIAGMIVGIFILKVVRSAEYAALLKSKNEVHVLQKTRINRPIDFWSTSRPESLLRGSSERGYSFVTLLLSCCKIKAWQDIRARKISTFSWQDADLYDAAPWLKHYTQRNLFSCIPSPSKLYGPNKSYKLYPQTGLRWRFSSSSLLGARRCSQEGRSGNARSYLASTVLHNNIMVVRGITC